MTEQSYKEKMVARFLTHGGGIFTKKTMQKLLGIKKLAVKGKTKVNFWYDRRENIKAALSDLELFIHVAGKDNINQTLNEETLRPIVTALLSDRMGETFLERVGPDLKMAEIAQLFIQDGFSYLQSVMQIPPHDQELISNAIALSHFLVEFFKPEKERRYITPSGAY